MKGKILLVEDQAVNRKLLGGILRRAGHEVVEASDGETALAIARQTPPDLVLLDIVLPGKDGFTVCTELKNDPDTGGIPVIFLSAKNEAADKVRGLDLGGADYIGKPFEAGEVLARVKTHLKMRRLTRDLLEANEELLAYRQRIEADLHAAGNIQQALLPQKQPATGKFGVAWRFLPCYKIGGDIFNIIRLDEHRYGLYMLDVSGHGIQSALMAVTVSQMLNPQCNDFTACYNKTNACTMVATPARVLEHLDQCFSMEVYQQFFTISYMVVDTLEMTISYSNAGHPPPVLIRSDGAMESLDAGGTFIGLDGILPFKEEKRRVRPGDKLVVYTDGITEYEDGGGRFFGEKRLSAQLKASRHLSAEAMVDAAIRAMRLFGGGRQPRDDVSILALEIKG